MAKRENDFDLIAGTYDVLTRIVFGKSMISAQHYFLSKIPASAKVLILGGGTGWIAEDLLRLNPSVQITYIDASDKMLEIAQKKLARHKNVRFIRGTQQAIPNEPFDVALTNFFLDLFSTRQLEEVILTIRTSLIRGGMWLVTDFEQTAWWHKTMLRMMYGFFRVISNVRVNQLPNWNDQILLSGFKGIDDAKFYGEFIRARLYKKVTE